jgi:hypothetical protein
VHAHEDASSSSRPLVFPKIEVIDLTDDVEYEYMYKRPTDLCCDVSFFDMYSVVLVNIEAMLLY